MFLRPALLSALFAGLALACSSSPSDDDAGRFRLVYSQDFTGREAVAEFALSDPRAWTWTGGQGRGSLELLGESDYHPPFRSPTSIALLPGSIFRDFDLEVDLLQTGRNYGHRDMCLFFGFQSPSRYYYVHLATSPDDHAHNIFLVNDAERTRLAEIPAEGIDWGDDQWHRVRIERRFDDGTIRVFWGDGPDPILTAVDTTFDWGRIGFGSFDDSGRITGIRVRAPGARVYTGPGNPFR
jgi:hypothetical protein